MPVPPPPDAKDFGDRMRAARKARRWTHKQAAERAGITDQYFSKIERGVVSFSEETRAAIAKTLDIEPHAKVATSAERFVELDATNPKDAVRATELYRRASPAARRAFDGRDPYTAGDTARDVEWYTRRLLHWIEEARLGLLDSLEPVPGATREDEPDPDEERSR